MKILDSAGLTYLWGQIKALVTGHTTITVADNVKTLTVGNVSATLVAPDDVAGKADKTTTVNGHALSSNVTVTKGDVGLGNVTNDEQIPLSQKGSANGVCPLDANTKIDSRYLPSYVDDVVEAYAKTGETALSSTWLATGSASGTSITPETGKIYVLMADYTETTGGTTTVVYAANTQFRWGGTTYVKLNDGGVTAITNAEIDVIVAS